MIELFVYMMLDKDTVEIVIILNVCKESLQFNSLWIVNMSYRDQTMATFVFGKHMLQKKWASRTGVKRINWNMVLNLKKDMVTCKIFEELINIEELLRTLRWLIQERRK